MKRPHQNLVLLATSVGGAGTMIVELAAVRLISPWFGSSAVVWTNVIAVVLFALSGGYLLGARLSRTADPVRLFGAMLITAGVLAAVLPLAASPVAEWFLPPSLGLHQAAGVVLWGSLATSLLLFFPPALCLGTIAPLAVETAMQASNADSTQAAGQDRPALNAGTAGGRILAASTLGSLIGVFGTSHFFVPHLGLRWTFLFAAALLILSGTATLFFVGRGKPATVGPIGWLVLAFIPPSQAEARPGETILASEESPYQRVRVVELEDSGPVQRLLQVNEGFDSFQSVWQPELGALPEGYYYNAFALPLHWLGDESRARVLVLGLGAGTSFRVLRGTAPEGMELELAGVELDPKVVELSRRHLSLEEPPAQGTSLMGVASGLDARLALRMAREDFELIILDCYSNQVEIPAHLATQEFFTEIYERLAHGGILAANLGGFGFDDPLVRSVALTCRSVWDGDVVLVRIPSSRNFCLFARREAELPIRQTGRVLSIPAVLRPALGALELEGMSQRFDDWRKQTDVELLTDDRAPLEVLQARSLAEAAKRRAGLERTDGGGGA